jgi:hypothetical protein
MHRMRGRRDGRLGACACLLGSVTPRGARRRGEGEAIRSLVVFPACIHHSVRPCRPAAAPPERSTDNRRPSGARQSLSDALLPRSYERDSGSYEPFLSNAAANVFFALECSARPWFPEVSAGSEGVRGATASFHPPIIDLPQRFSSHPSHF